jgi:hypothetical protein
MEVKDVLYIAGGIFSALFSALVAYIAGRAQIRKTNLEGKILTADKIDEFVSALVKAKLDMHEIAVQLQDCLNDKKKCVELRERLNDVIQLTEDNAEEAIRILKAL